MAWRIWRVTRHPSPATRYAQNAADYGGMARHPPPLTRHPLHTECCRIQWNGAYGASPTIRHPPPATHRIKEYDGMAHMARHPPAVTRHPPLATHRMQQSMMEWRIKRVTHHASPVTRHSLHTECSRINWNGAYNASPATRHPPPATRGGTPTDRSR